VLSSARILLVEDSFFILMKLESALHANSSVRRGDEPHRHAFPGGTKLPSAWCETGTSELHSGKYPARQPVGML
jgi:hypothetical protein